MRICEIETSLWALNLRESLSYLVYLDSFKLNFLTLRFYFHWTYPYIGLINFSPSKNSKHLILIFFSCFFLFFELLKHMFLAVNSNSLITDRQLLGFVQIRSDLQLGAHKSCHPAMQRCKYLRSMQPVIWVCVGEIHFSFDLYRPATCKVSSCLLPPDVPDILTDCNRDWLFPCGSLSAICGLENCDISRLCSHALSKLRLFPFCNLPVVFNLQVWSSN